MNRLAPLLVSLVVADAAHAETFSLRCDGEVAIYEGGFGQETTHLKSTRVVTIDTKGWTATTNTVFGDRSAPLIDTSGNRWYAFTLRHDEQHWGKLIATETVSLNRYTGEMNAIYYLDPPEGSGVGYMAFSGKCQRAAPKF